MDLDSTYAPQSPDLSGEESLPQPHPQHQYRGSISHISPFVTPTDSKSPFNFPHSASSEVAPPHQFQQHPQLLQLQQPLQQFQQQQEAYHNPYFSNAVPTHSIMKQEPGYDEDEEYQNAKAKASASRKKVKQEDGDPNGSGPVFAEGIEVRTKFPVARIKRIMQADEDVGKVAQVTPVAVSKALELFMISIITKAAEQAKQRSSKRVLATHLKQAVTSEEQFDFLTEIVAKVPDAPAPQSKQEGDSDDPMEGVKKKRAAPRRKRKEPADDF